MGHISACACAYSWNQNQFRSSKLLFTGTLIFVSFTIIFTYYICIDKRLKLVFFDYIFIYARAQSTNFILLCSLSALCSYSSFNFEAEDVRKRHDERMNVNKCKRCMFSLLKTVVLQYIDNVILKYFCFQAIHNYLLLHTTDRLTALTHI